MKNLKSTYFIFILFPQVITEQTASDHHRQMLQFA